MARGGVFDRVRQPLLHESVSRQVDAGRQRHRLAFDIEVRGEPGVAGLRDELVDPTQARLRRQRWAFRWIAQSSDDLSHLGERLAPGLLHCEEGLAFLGLFGAEQPTHSRRLDRHDAEAVADDVVQFAGDAGAFLDDGPERVDLVFLFEPRGVFLGGVGAHTSVAKREAGQPHERVQGSVFFAVLLLALVVK